MNYIQKTCFLLNFTLINSHELQKKGVFAEFYPGNSHELHKIKAFSLNFTLRNSHELHTKRRFH